MGEWGHFARGEVGALWERWVFRGCWPPQGRLTYGNAQSPGRQTRDAPRGCHVPTKEEQSRGGAMLGGGQRLLAWVPLGSPSRHD